MTDVALISDLTWRTLEMQREAFPDMPHFIAPDDIPTMLRASTRRRVLNVCVLSLGVIADNRIAVDEFIRLCKRRKASVYSKETSMTWCYTQSSASLIDAWIRARKNGASKAGGEKNAKRAMREFWKRFAIIKDVWHGDFKSQQLLREAGIGHHDTVRVNLGYTRWEWRRLTDTKRQRILEKQYGKQ